MFAGMLQHGGQLAGSWCSCKKQAGKKVMVASTHHENGKGEMCSKAVQPCNPSTVLKAQVAEVVRITNGEAAVHMAAGSLYEL